MGLGQVIDLIHTLIYVMLIASAVFVVVMMIAGGKIFEKAGQPGWLSLIPIVNMFVYLKIIKRSYWRFILYCIPLLNLVFILSDTHRFSKAFDKGFGYTLGMIFLNPIFTCMLAFGSAQYNEAALD